MIWLFLLNVTSQHYKKGSTMEYYVFDTEQLALDAEAAINTIGGAPITGNRSSDGLPQPDKQKTERWAIPKERLDGKWVFPRVIESIRETYSEEVTSGFDSNFPHTIEIYNSDWFPNANPY